MKFGMPLMVGPRNWVSFTQEAESAGFESVWLPEHLIMPVEMHGHPGHPDDGESPIPSDLPVWDVWMQIAFLAPQTSTIRFGTNVYNIGLRHPFVTARAVTTADLMTGGRVEFGIGSSWMSEEWQAVQQDFATRGKRVDESIRVIQRLFTEDVIEHSGEFFEFQPVKFFPKPVQGPYPPMVIGGDSPAAMRRAAELGDGWIPMEQTLDTLPGNLEKVAELRQKYGRTGPFEVTLGAIGGATVDGIRRLEDLGVDRVLVAPWTSLREAVDGIRRFGDEVIPHFTG
jgi:probable F420-dependent oxidoreductase